MLLAEPTHNSETEMRVPSSCPNSSDPGTRARHSQRCANLLAVRHCEALAQGSAQVCQFHALRDASRVISEQERAAKVAVRQKLQPKIREYRSDPVKRKVSATAAEWAQDDMLDRYTACAQAAVHMDGLTPFRYAGLQMQ
jgi:hypothetical protein